MQWYYFTFVWYKLYHHSYKAVPESYHSSWNTDLSWCTLNSMIQVKTLSLWKAMICVLMAFKKKFQTHPLKSAEASERSACPLQNYLRFSWLIRGVRERGGGHTPWIHPSCTTVMWCWCWWSFYCKNITEFLHLWHTCFENLLSGDTEAWRKLSITFKYSELGVTSTWYKATVATVHQGDLYREKSHSATLQWVSLAGEHIWYKNVSPLVQSIWLQRSKLERYFSPIAVLVMAFTSPFLAHSLMIST